MRRLCGGETHDSDCMSKEERERRRGQEQEANNSNNAGWGEQGPQSTHVLCDVRAGLLPLLGPKLTFLRGLVKFVPAAARLVCLSLVGSCLSRFANINFGPSMCHAGFLHIRVSEFAIAEALPETERSLRSRLLEGGTRRLFPKL